MLSLSLVVRETESGRLLSEMASALSSVLGGPTRPPGESGSEPSPSGGEVTVSAHRYAQRSSSPAWVVPGIGIHIQHLYAEIGAMSRVTCVA